MLTGHSPFYLSQPAIYFGVPGLELEPHAEFQFEFFPFFPTSIQPNTGMYIDWYDVPE